MSASDAHSFFGHPGGLRTLFLTELWERFSYYGMRAILMLYMTAKVVDGGMEYDAATAGAIYGLYTAGVYLTALWGGYIADHFLGQQKSVWYGGIVIAAGHFVMAIPYESGFFLGMFLIVMGTGLLKPNVSSIVGELYTDAGSRRDAGFSIFYMGINIGAFIGPFVCGYLGENVDWHLGFGAAGVGMVLGLIQYKMTERHLGDAGLAPKVETKDGKPVGLGFILQKHLIGIAVGTVIILTMQFTGVADFTSVTGIADATTGIIIGIALVYFAYLLVIAKFNKEEKKNIMGIIVLFLCYAMFMAGFEQAGSSLNLFGKYATNLDVFGWEMPASFLQSLNPIFIIIFAPLFGAMWVWLGRRNLDPSIPLKFALGLIFVGVGFLVMMFAAKLAIESQVGMTWLTLTYLFHTWGELCLSPVGLSSITKLAPRRIVSQMMGVWFLGASLGNLIAGRMAGKFDFSELTNVDSALDAINAGAASGEGLSQEVLGKIDPSIIEKLDPAVIQSGSTERLLEALQPVLDVAQRESMSVMPDLFWQIVITTVGSGLVMLVLTQPLKGLMKVRNQTSN